MVAYQGLMEFDGEYQSSGQQRARAHTGEGLEELRALIERDLPRPAHEVHALVPYQRGELVARAHARGEVLAQEHTEVGTRLHARVPGDLAGQLEPYVVSPTA